MRKYSSWLVVLCLVLFQKTKCYSQLKYYFGGEKTIVELDPTSDLPETAFPFDRNFLIRKYLPLDEGVLETFSLGLVIDPNAIGVDSRYALFHQGVDSYGKNVSRILNCIVRPTPGGSKYASTHSSFDIFVPFVLSPTARFDMVYTKSLPKVERDALSECFVTMYNNRHSLNQECKDMLAKINLRKARNQDDFQISEADFQAFYDQAVKESLIADMIAQIKLDTIRKKYSDLLVNQPALEGGKVLFLEYKVLANAVSTDAFKFETRAGYLLQPDFGLVYYGFGGVGDIGISRQFRGLMPYVGVNLLFRQFDGDVRLSQLPRGHVQWWQRISLHGGLTLLTLSKENQRKNLLGSFNPIVGLGYRLTSAIKIVGGVIVYNKVRYDQIFDETQTQGIGYLGFSVDLRVRKLLGDIGSIFTPK